MEMVYASVNTTNQAYIDAMVNNVYGLFGFEKTKI